MNEKARKFSFLGKESSRDASVAFIEVVYLLIYKEEYSILY
jgi:hypothetical protein